MRTELLTSSTQSSASIYSLDEILEKIPLGYFHYRLLVICGMSFMADAMEVTLLSFISTCAGSDWDLEDSEIALIASVVFVGVLVGSLVWGPFADRFGRRYAFIYASLIIITAGFFSGLAPNYPTLLVLRTLCGFGVGGSTVPFDLLAEFLPNSYRGRFLIYIEYFWTIGSIFVAGMAWIILSQSNWRVLTMVTSIPVAIALLGSIVVLPESPRWLLSKGRTKEAVEIIQNACKINNTPLDHFTLAPLFEVTDEHVPISEFLKPEQRKVSLPLWTVWISFGFTYYGIILFVSKVFSENDDDNDDDDDENTCDFSYLDIFISATSEVIGVFVAGAVIDRYGRRPTQSIGYAIGAICVFLMGYDIPSSLVTTFGILARCAVMGASCATWVATPELFPTPLRATGHSISSSVARIGSFSAPFLVSSNLSNVSIGIFLAVVSAIGSCAALILPETLGKTLDEVTGHRPLSVDSYRKTHKSVE